MKTVARPSLQEKTPENQGSVILERRGTEQIRKHPFLNGKSAPGTTMIKYFEQFLGKYKAD
jgi:hypothetical protein